MPNTKHPAHHETDSQTGLCLDCDHVGCEICGVAILPADAHESPSGWACTPCHDAAKAAYDALPDSDGVPVAVDPDETSAQTVREQLTTGEVAAYWTGVIVSRRAA